MLKAKSTSSFTNLFPIDWFHVFKRLNKPNEPIQELNNRLQPSIVATKKVLLFSCRKNLYYLFCVSANIEDFYLNYDPCFIVLFSMCHI